MILNFKVKNFRSFKEEQELSFVLGKEERVQPSRRVEVKTKAGNYRVLKNGIIYGANASGKSNIFKALFLFTDLVLRPTFNDNQGLLTNTFSSNQENTRFALTFFKKNHLFTYILEYNQKEVIYERLEKDNVLILERNFQEFQFPTVNRLFKTLIPTIRKTTLFLHFAQMNNLVEAQEAYSWFFDFRNLSNDSLLKELKTNEKLKEKMLYALQFADFNITDIQVEETMRPVLSIGIPLGSEETNDFQKQHGMQPMIDIYLVHENNGKKFRILLQDESEGTIQFFHHILILLSEKNFSNVVIVSDEFNRSLHKKLANAFIKLINSEANKIQFIATSHESDLMNLQQKHQIYFVEKNAQGESEIFKLSDFDDIEKIRKDAKFSTKYEAGLFGADQIINEAGLLNLLEE